ncbi:MAG: VWA domain-containing protein, partial [Methylococcaceae bacterium]|nr:VWA domain-containing protein [Methylococcaceae bacterium]
SALAAEPVTEGGDKTLSPYFFVHSDDPGVDRLPLKATAVEATVSGVIADVVVRQSYRNEGSRPIEAQYLFPGSTRAAVYGMTLQVGERRIEARVREQQQARAHYEAAKAEGKSAALLEQQRPNVFQMNVANILPGDDIQVELRYTELLVPTNGVYQFVYPTVVGPRYSNQPAASAPAAERWIANPYLHQGEPPPGRFDFKLVLEGGMPIQDLSSRSHQMDVYFERPDRAVATLAGPGGDRDLIVDYRLAGQAIQTGLLLHQGETENFFLAMIEPPASVTPEAIPPRDYVFVLDVSGSMNGFPLDTAKTLLRELIGRLKPEDSFNVLLFSGANELLSEHSLPADPVSIGRALAFIDAQRGGGGTELLPALRRALAIPAGPQRSRSIVVVTDGYVAVETETFELIRRNLGQANLFAFGIGSSVNRFLIEGMARAGRGEPFIVTAPGEAEAEAERLRRYIETPVLTHLSYRFDGFEAYDVEPARLPDLFAQRPVILFGKWRWDKTGTLTVTGSGGAGSFSQTLDLGSAETRPETTALRYLWARSRLAELADYEKVHPDSELAREITTLGLSYNLLTSHTSFLAVDTVVRNTDPAAAATVKQPLPLPAGVGDLAVGNPVPGSPEPETWLLFGAASAVFAWARRRQQRHG